MEEIAERSDTFPDTFKKLVRLRVKIEEHIHSWPLIISYVFVYQTYVLRAIQITFAANSTPSAPNSNHTRRVPDSLSTRDP